MKTVVCICATADCDCIHKEPHEPKKVIKIVGIEKYADYCTNYSEYCEIADKEVYCEEVKSDG